MASRVEAYLGVADDLCTRVEAFAAAANATLAQKRYPLTYRDRVMIGFALKIDSAFRALISDVRVNRSESMHHLKTMTESYIYFLHVAGDPTEVAARRVMADTWHAQAVFLKETGGDPEEIRDCEAERDALRAGAEKLPSVQALAHGQGEAFRTGWYSRVYRLACESAHTGDLFTFMPDPEDQRIVINAPMFASQSARYAIHYALAIVLNVFQTALDQNDLGLTGDISDLTLRYKAAREAIASTDQNVPDEETL